MKIKKYFSSLVLLIALLAGCVVGTPRLLAQEKGHQPQTLKEFSDFLPAAAPYFASLLQLEDNPPADAQRWEDISNYKATYDNSKSIALPVTVGLQAALCNLFCAYGDPFGLYTEKVKPYIKQVVKQNADGSLYDHYEYNLDQQDIVLGYLNCLDIQIADRAASQIAGDNSDQIYNNIYIADTYSSPSKQITLNLGYDYLSSTTIPTLEPAKGPYYASNGDWVSIKNVAYTENLNQSQIPLNAFSLSICVAFQDNVTDDGYGDVFKRNNRSADPNNNYTP